jgi:ArsR family metal-binding transcriptional regulator
MLANAGKESSMLLKEYRKEIFRPDCNHNFQSLHCIAHLDSDIAGVLPYLNTTLGGSTYIADPPSMAFKFHGKLITIHARRIAINALKDEEEADRVLKWLRQEINETWEKREHITPSYHGISKPRVLEILRLLPRANCRQCGQTTCMVFAVLVADGAKGPEDCPGLPDPNKTRLQQYLQQFSFEF